jgi:predicted lipoprotein with Yx(FWY)xxD motif
MTVRERAVSRRIRWLVAALAAVFVCSSASALASSGAVITSQEGQLGPMLVARNGHTLYLFHQDAGGKSYCYGSCASVWRPDITAARPTTPTGSGLNSDLLGTIRRRDGQLQATYSGHPLYLYAGDKSAGVMNGEGRDQFGGRWYAVGPKGKALKPFNPGQY